MALVILLIALSGVWLWRQQRREVAQIEARKEEQQRREREQPAPRQPVETPKPEEPVAQSPPEVDRGFRNGEPTQIRLELVYFAQQQQSRNGSPVDRSPTAAENYPDAQNVGTYTVQLIGAVSPVKR
ncbi:MAG TPA: hypothetical protein VGD61_00370 [Pyrinomonadaceae bacterium]